MQSVSNDGLGEATEAINRTLTDSEITIVGDSGTNRITSSSGAGKTILTIKFIIGVSADQVNHISSMVDCIMQMLKKGDQRTMSTGIWKRN
jgi:hypothetical protein